MQIQKVVGIEHSIGNFTDPKTNKLVEYDNYIIYSQYKSDKVTGIKCEVNKIKTAQFRDNIEVGDYIEIVYDLYKNPYMAILVQKGERE